MSSIGMLTLKSRNGTSSATPVDVAPPPIRVRRVGGAGMWQRVAGFQMVKVVHLARQVARLTRSLHKKQLAHLDIKLRNILLRHSGGQLDLILCDLDASMRLGIARGRDEKPGSSAYYAPEVARWAEDLLAIVPLIASEAMDVWSLGALLFELCNGRTLFRQGAEGGK